VRFGVISQKIQRFRTADLSERGEALLQVGKTPREVDAPIVSTIHLPPHDGTHWFAISTTPRHEKRVAQFLAQRQLEHYLPLYRTTRRWKNGSTAQLELPLFPGYLFVRIDKAKRIPILGLPGVMGFVGTRSGPSELNEGEIEALRSGLHVRKAEPYFQLAIGERVRIKTGPLAGLTGTLVRNASGVRLVLTVELIHQSVAVEIDAHDVESAEKSPLHPSYLCKGNA
jgi:transcription antitermination factor NusG